MKKPRNFTIPGLGSTPCRFMQLRFQILRIVDIPSHRHSNPIKSLTLVGVSQFNNVLLRFKLISKVKMFGNYMAFVSSCQIQTG